MVKKSLRFTETTAYTLYITAKGTILNFNKLSVLNVNLLPIIFDNVLVTTGFHRAGLGISYKCIIVILNCFGNTDIDVRRQC